MNQLRALVIDDNTQNVKVLTQLLAKSGVDAVEVINPVTLSKVLPAIGPVNIIFLDLEMPGMDGYQVKDLLRSQLGDTPIVAYTVHTSEIDVVRASGFDGFLGKPLNSNRFPDQLARILRGEKVWERV